MAIKTNVHIRYRTPYMPGINLPKDTEKLMRKEISDMRKDLLRKQEALERSKRYSSNTRLKKELSELNVKKLNTTQKVWNTWNRLRNLELSNETSVSGKNRSREKAIASFHQSGFTQVNEKNYDDFAKFMEVAKDKFQALLWDSEQLLETYFEYIEDGAMDGMSAIERYNFIVSVISDELHDHWRYYNTESKYKQGFEKTTNLLNRTNLAKQAFNVPYSRKRVSNTEIKNYKYQKGKKLK